MSYITSSGVKLTRRTPLQIVEGAITIFCGLVSFFYIADFPEENRFLKPEETAYILKRIEDDRGDSVPDALTGRKIIKHLSDWTMWAYGMISLFYLLA
jgi:hypothetical protein